MSATRPHASGPAPEEGVTDGASATESRQSRTEQSRPEEQPDTSTHEDGNTGNEPDQKEEEPSSEEEEIEEGEETSAPPLPDEVPPPLPDEAPRGRAEDDGWEPVWDGNAQAYYFYNRFTGLSQWENPRVPHATAPGPGPGSGSAGANSGQDASSPPNRKSPPAVGGYNPAVHGDYDPTAPYAQQYEDEGQSESGARALDPTTAYAATGSFNRFTGRWQADSIQPDNYNPENKAQRQMNAFFDVDAAANSHDGRSLRAERSAKKLSKKELKVFREKRREKKEEKRRAWLRD